MAELEEEKKVTEEAAEAPAEEAPAAEEAPVADAADAEEAPKKKKENAFSKFWKNTKQSVNDSILEGKIKSAFEKANTEFTIYTKNETFSNTVYGKVEGNVLTVFGKQEVKPFAVVVTQDDAAKAYYVVESAPATVTSSVEGVSYEREGTAITLDENVEEVNVVKAGKRYFIYKGENKK